MTFFLSDVCITRVCTLLDALENNSWPVLAFVNTWTADNALTVSLHFWNSSHQFEIFFINMLLVLESGLRNLVILILVSIFSLILIQITDSIWCFNDSGLTANFHNIYFAFMTRFKCF